MYERANKGCERLRGVSERTWREKKMATEREGHVAVRFERLTMCLGWRVKGGRRLSRGT